MKTRDYISKNLWLIISICWVIACKSRSTPPVHTEAPIANPQPAMEAQTDSLKNVLDKQREQKRKK